MLLAKSYRPTCLFVILIYKTPKMAQNPQAAAAAAAAAPAAPALAPGQVPAPRQAPLARPVVVPPTFGGASQDDWHCFIARFDAACVVNGYRDAERLQFLPCCFKESAFTTYQTILAAHPQYTYVEMCTELGLRFAPPQQSRLLEAEFRARLKRSTESQAEFAAALQRLAARAFPGQQGPLLDRLTLNQFIDGQVNSDLRLHIRTSSPAALDAAVRRAYEVAAILEVENRRSLPVPTPACAALTASMPQAHSAGPLADPTPTSSATVAHVAPSSTSSSTDPLVLSLLSKISDQLADLQVFSATSAPSPRAYSDDTRAPRGRGHSVFPRSAPMSGPTRFPGSSNRNPPPYNGTGRGLYDGARDRGCFNCSDPSHFRRDCPHSTRGGRPSGNRY